MNSKERGSSRPAMIITPQFERPADDPKPMECPETLAQWEYLEKVATDGELQEWGLRRWNDPETDNKDDWPDEPEVFTTKTLWLLPGEWYSSIEKGLVFTDIFGEPVTHPGNNDTRFGCLAYGILR